MFHVAEEKLIEHRAVSWFQKALATLASWHSRYQARSELAHLLRLGFVGDRELRDIGITRADVAYEAEKPFWQGCTSACGRTS